MRICSLFPTATEMLYALGLGRSVVGRSEHCTYPPSVRAKPIVVRSRVKKAAPQDSRAIHQAVQKLKTQGAHQFDIDVRGLKRLKPDLVITQNLCSVCAASHSEVSTALQYLWPRPRVLTLEAQRLDQVFTDFKKLASATGREKKALEVIEKLRRRMDAVRERIANMPRPRVWCCEWLEPPMAAGHWVPEMVELAGGTDGLGYPGKNSAWLTWERIRSYNPEVIVAMPCSYSIRQTLQERTQLTHRPGWKSISAAKRGRVFAVDGSFYHHAGPRLIDGVELFAHLFHPDRVSAGALRGRARSLTR